MRVLAVGATGGFVGLVVPALVRRGIEVRALVHDPAEIEAIRARGASETVVADLRDRPSIDRAVDGVDGVFHVVPAFAEDSTRIGTDMVDAAVAAGVGRFVFQGVYHPSLSLVNHADLRPVEEALHRSELGFTIVQPAMFLQGLTRAWAEAIDSGEFTLPYSRDSLMSFVDYRDVADVVATAFATDDLLGGTFELALRGMYRRTDIAEVMSRHADREVLARDVDPVTAVTDVPAGAERDGLGAMFADYSRYGFHGGNDLVLRTILGRAPRTVDAFFAELAAAR